MHQQIGIKPYQLSMLNNDIHYLQAPDILYQYESGMTKIKGINKNIDDSLTWSLTNIDFSPYKKVKFYITPGISSNNIAPPAIVEVVLDALAADSNTNNHYTGSFVGLYLNNSNRLYCVTCCINSDKTSCCILRQESLYGTAGTSAVDDSRYLYKIEGYYE